MAVVASPGYLTIPDALAQLAHAMLAASPIDGVDLSNAIDAAFGSAGYDEPRRIWEMDPVDLFEEAVSILGHWPPDPPSDAAAFAKSALALELLDQWHAPLVAPAIHLDKTISQNEALDYQVDSDRFNLDNEFGTVVPHSYLGVTPSRKSANPFANPVNYLSVVFHLLEFAAYIPPKVIAGDPDGLGGHKVTRNIALKFRRFSYDDIQLSFADSELKVALAPGVQSTTDVRFWTDGSSYSIVPTYLEDRFEKILRSAIKSEAHILLMPEMSVSGVMLKQLCKQIPLARADYFSKTGILPKLSAAVVGVIADPVGGKGGGLHRNYLALINSDGEIILEQEKLSHWNLDERAQNRFGLTGKGYNIPLQENTSVGEVINIADIDGLGRVIGLICADMSHDMPGDWITDNIGLDAIYAPIMDGSTCWLQGVAPWIIKRSVRSCRRSGVAVIVTNSPVMTHWNNSVIQAEVANAGKSRYSQYQECGIGFLVKKSSGNMLVKHVKYSISLKDVVVETIYWNRGWGNLDKANVLFSLV